jgi:nicotinamidase-related amidase
MPNTETRTLRSDDCALLVIDMQTRLMPAIDGGEKMVAKAVFLAEVAEKLGVPMLFTEQNPSGLGPTVPPLKPFVEQLFVKRHFSAAREPGFFEHLPPGRMTIVVVGAETHVCVLQTVLGLRDRNYGVAVVSDAVGSRYMSDKEAGLRRMAEHGAEIVTAEMVAFEWLDTCDNPDFKAVIALVKGL